MPLSFLQSTLPGMRSYPLMPTSVIRTSDRAFSSLESQMARVLTGASGMATRPIAPIKIVIRPETMKLEEAGKRGQ